MDIKYLKRQTSYPKNARQKNFYLHYDNFINKLSNTQRNFYLSNKFNKFFCEDINKINHECRNEKGIDKKYKSTGIGNINNYNLNSEERLEEENKYLFSSLNKLKEDLLFKDQEIEEYKEKMMSLLRSIHNKNNIINNKNYFIARIISENCNNKKMIENEKNKLLILSNRRLQNYMNKNSELKNKIIEQNKYILTERKKFMNFISKIKDNYNKIREDSKKKDNKIKSLYILFTKNKKKIRKNLSQNIYYNQLNYNISKYRFQINNKKINNNNFITKNYFMIENKRIIKNSKGNNDNLEAEIKKNKEIISLKEKLKNKMQKEINDLNSNISEKNNLIKKQEEKLKKYEKINIDLKNELNSLKQNQNDITIINNNNENIIKIKEETIKKYGNEKIQLKEVLNDLKNNNLKQNKLYEKCDNIINDENILKDLFDFITQKENIIKEKSNEIEIINNKLLEKEEIIKKLENEIKEKKKEIENKEKYINELKISLKKYDDNFQKEIFNKNESIKILKENTDQINNELSKVNNLRFEDFNTINKLNKNIILIKEENIRIKAEILELKQKTKNDEKKIIEVKKENENLNKTNSQLNENIMTLKEKLNALNTEYQENKSTLNKKETEINDLKEVTQALIEKQKNELELKDKNERISPYTHFIISRKKYKKLQWYLVSIINPDDDKISNDKKNNYNNYKWVTELAIPKNQLKRYNKFTDDENKNNDINISYIHEEKQSIQKDLEINKINLNNKKLIPKNEKLGKFLEKKEYLDKSNPNKKVSNKDNNINSENNSIIDKIMNYYDNRELNFKSEIAKLETHIKNTENFQLRTNEINEISLENESDFIDFNEIEGDNIIQYLKDKKLLIKKEDDKDENILNDIPGDDSDYDVIKGLKIQAKYLKKDNKEKDIKFNNLSLNIKELIKNLKFDDKIKPQLSNILQLLGYSSDNIKFILNNNNGFFSFQ